MRSFLPGKARKLVPQSLALCFLLLACSVFAGAQQVTLDSATSPSYAQPGVQILTLNGDGFPTDPIHPQDVDLIMTPAPAGAVVHQTPLLVTQISGGSVRIRFTVPSSLSVNAPTVYNVSLKGITMAGTAFYSRNSAVLTVNPASSIVLSPNHGESGSTVLVNIVGNLTDFVQGATFATFGPGIGIGSGALGAYGYPPVLSATSAKATITIDPTAAPGGRTVTVATGAQQATASFLVSAPHQPPVADAGPQQLVSVASTVQLDGSHSTSPSGSPLTFSWSLLSAPSNSSAHLSDSSVVNPTFVADASGQYVAQLTVNDGVTSTSASVTISTRNTAPVANAGAGQSVPTGSIVHLDGSGSTDADGDSLTYQWQLKTKPAGSAASLSNVNSITPSFMADVQGTYSAELSVNDGHGNTSSASVNISTLNQPPVAKPGNNQTVPIGIPAQLDGSASTDPDGDTLTYSWSLTFRPTGSSTTLSNATTAAPSLTPDVPGHYVVQLTVDDGNAHATSATVTVSTNNSAPIANAGAGQTVDAGSTVTLDGTASHDPDGTDVTYSWSFASKPTGSTATFDSASSATPKFTANVAGQYVAQLIVSDGALQSTPATMLVLATAPDAHVNPPSIDFGSQPVAVTSGSKPVLVTNSGTAPLSLNGVLITGSNADQFQFTAPSMPATVAPGDTATVNVTFTPTAPGARTAALMIPQAPNGGTTVNLVGTGVNTPVLTYTPGALNFGSVAVGTTATAKQITVSNAGTGALTITALTITGSAPGDYTASIGALPVDIPPNGSKNIDVTFTPTAAGSRGAVLQIADNADGSPHIISLSGSGTAAGINFLPSLVSFANQAINSTSSAIPVTVSNNGTSPLTVTSMSVTGANNTEFAFTAPARPFTVAAGASVSISITFTPSDAGPRTASLTFTDNAPGSPHQLPLSGTGVTSALIAANPTSVTFGSAPVSSTVNQPVVLSNSGTGDLVITAFTVNGVNAADFVGPTNTLPLTIPMGGTANIQVGFTPSVVGARSASLDITSNAKTGTLHVPLSGTGTAPALLISPTSVAFGNQLIHGTSAAKTVTLTNNGTASVTISNLALAGIAASDFTLTAPATPFNIAAGANVVLSLTFTPGATGARAASLSITDTAPGSPHAVSLSGTGTAPGITIAPPSIAFGNQRVATPSSPSSITITNTGSADLIVSALTITGTNAADFTLAAVTLPLTIPANTNKTLNVTFNPGDSGARSATLTITHNATGGTGTVDFTGTGTVGATTISFNPAALDLGSSPVGTSTASKNVTISNTGNANLVISKVEITGVNAADFTFTGPTLPQSVFPGGFSFISVTAKPSAVGPRTATLIITSNAAGSPHSVTLTTSGVGTPIITLAPTSLDFGSQDVSFPSAPKSLTIRNTGTDNLVISSLSIIGSNASEFSFTLPTLPLTIAAGANVVVPIKFTPVNTGLRSASFRIADNATGSPHLVPLSGTGTIASVSISPSSVTFGSRPIGTTSSPTPVTLTNTGSGVLTISAISLTGAQAGDFGLTTPTLPATVQPNANIVINVTFTPTATGTRNASVSITDNGSGNPHSVSLTGTATAAGPGIDFAPGSVSFGNQLVGTTSSATPVTISNPGNQNLVITSIVVAGANAADFSFPALMLPITVLPNGSTVVAVSFSPHAAGNRTASLTVSDNAPNSPQSIALLGNGTAPQISVNPPSLPFTNQPVGSPSAPLTLTVTNFGTAPLTISGLQIAGAQASSFALSTPPALPVTVPPTGMMQLRVVFTPAAMGANNASLSITHNASGSPTSVALSGTGVGSGAGISISPPALSFGAVDVNTTSAVKPVVISNTGSGNLTVTALAITGSNASNFAITSGSPLPLSVSPGGLVVLSATFTPSAGGVRTATLMITDNASGSPQSITLTGSGTIKGPAITVPPSLPFGNQLVNTASVPVALVITNPGTSSLIITALTKSGANPGEFATQQNLPLTVLAGATATINFTFTPAAPGLRSATLSIVDNAPASPQSVSLTGTGTAPVIALNPPSLDFGNQAALATSDPLPIVISNTGTGNLIVTNLAIGATQFHFTAGTLPITIAPGANTTVNVTFTPSRTGLQTGSLDITDNAPGSPHSAGLQGNGIAASISFTPDTGAFGNQLVNTTSTPLPVTITNSGSINLVISALTITGANASNFGVTSPTLPITVIPGGNTVINLTFTPSAAGVRTASLSVTDSALGSPHLYALSGTGTAPALTFAPPSVNFGDLQISGTSAPTTVTISNTGNGNLIISGITLGGANPGDFAFTPITVPVTIAPGANATVPVTFKPTSVGIKNAMLLVASNVSGSPSALALTGNGTPVPILSFPPSVTFPAQLINTSSTPKSISLGNTGAGTLTITNLAITGANAGDFTLVSGTLPISITNGSTVTISVTFTPTALGSRNASLMLTTNAPGSPQAITLSGTSIGAPAIQVGGPISFGNQMVGFISSPQQLSITNTGTADLTISSMTVVGANPAEFSFTAGPFPITIAPNGGITVPITFTPASTGTRTATLNITHNATGSPTGVSLSGAGIAPSVKLAPTSVTFGNQVVNSPSAPQTVVLTNQGSADLVITAMSFVGGQASDFGVTSPTLPITVTAGNSISLNLTFTPSAAGARSSVLNIMDNASTSPQTLPVSGTGTSPNVVFAPPSADFGTVLVNTSSNPTTITVSNTGNGPLVISAVAITGAQSGDFAVSNPTLPITVVPNGNTSFSVTFKPTAAGPRAGTLSLTTNAPNSPNTAALTGIGNSLPGISVTPSPLTFASQLVNTASSPAALTITNTGTANLVISSVTATGPQAADFAPSVVGTLPLTVTPGSTATVNVTFTPAAIGARNGTIVIASNAPSTPTNVSVSGTGFGVPSLSTSPAALAFGNVLLGTSTGPTPLTLTNNGTADLVITALAITGTNITDFALSPFSPPLVINPGKSSVITINFTPAALGARSASLRISDNAADSPQMIALTGAGTRPGISVAPISIDFGAQSLNIASTSTPLTITNSGTADLVISGITSTGTNPTEFAAGGVTFPLTITPGANKVVNVTFTPTALGARSATLHISHNAPGSVTNVPLTGTGVAPIISFTPAGSLSFPGTVVGITSTALPLRIDNTGTGPLNITDLKIEGANPTEFTFTAGTLPITVQPGGNVSIQVTFTPAATGSRSATLRITDNATGSPHAINLVGTGTQGLLSPDLTTISFGNQLVPTPSAPRPLTLRNTGTATINISAISLAGANPGDFSFTGATLPIAIAAGSNTVINVTFTPSVNGARAASLLITHDAPNSPATITLTGTGTAPVIGLNPTTIPFANQLVGVASASVPVSVTNTGLGNLIISAIAFTGTNPGDFTFTSGTLPITVPPSSNISIPVTFKPTNTGFRSASLSLTDNSSGSPHTVTVSGTATAPIYSADVTSLTFGSTLAGTNSMPMNVTVTNIGTGNLVISALTFGGANFTDFSTSILTLPVTILPNTNLVIPVTFSPTAGGSRTASLSITDSATGSPHNVDLSGTGTAPIIGIAPPSLTFPTTNVGSSSAQQPITISNTGTGDLIITSIGVTGAGSSDYSFSAGTTPLHVAPGANTVVNVTFTPRSPGSRAAAISFTDNATGSPQPVLLSGVGMSPTADLNVSTLDFGNVLTGANSAVKVITVTNNGNASLVITGLSVTGANPADFLLSNGFTPQTVAAGASLNFSFIFHPRSAGDRLATFNITDNAPSSPQTVMLTGKGTGIGILSMNQVTVGNNLETVATVALSIPPTNDVAVTISSSNPSLVILGDSSGTAPGSGSITVTIPGGATSAFPGFYVQGLAASGSATMTLTASGFTTQTSTVNLSPSGFVLLSPGGQGVDFTTVIGALDTAMTINPVRLDNSNNVLPGTGKIRGGASFTIPFTSADTNVGTIIGTAIISGGANASNATAFHPKASGSTLLSLGMPAGFNTPTTGSQLTANVRAPMININPVNVGANLQTRGVGSLEAPAPAGGIQVTITSMNPSVALLSTVASAAGASSVIVTVPEGSTALPDFFVFGMSTVANAQLVASAPGYGFTPGGTAFNGSVAVTPSGFQIAGPSGSNGANFSTTTISGNSRLTVTVFRLDPQGNPVSDGQLRGGLSVSVPVISGTTSVGTIVNGPAVIQNASTSTNGVLFDPNLAGTTTLSLGTPSVAGFSTPHTGATLVVTVSQPQITFSLPTTSIGSNLQLDGSAKLTAPAPGNLTVTIASSNPQVLISSDPTMPGAQSVNIVVLNGQGLDGSGFPPFYIQGVGAAGNTATLTASASGYTGATVQVTVTPAGFVLIGPNGLGQDFATLIIQGDPVLTVSSVQLQAGTLAPQATQSVRGGLTPSVLINSSNGSIGTVNDSPAMFTGGVSSATVHFSAHSVGQTKLTIPVPAGYSMPANGSSLNVSVH